MIDGKQRWLKEVVCDGLKGLSAKVADVVGDPNGGTVL